MKKALKITVWTIVVLVLLLFGIQWWLGSKIKHVLEDKVKEETHGMVQMDIGHVKVRLIGRSVELKDIQVSSDTIRKDSMKQSWGVVDGRIRKIALSGVHFSHQDSLIKVRLRKLSFDVGDLSVTARKPSQKGQQSEMNIDSLYKGVLKLDIEKIHILAGDIGFRQIQAHDTVSYRLKDFRFQVTDWQFDNGNDTAAVPFSCQGGELSFLKFQYVFAEKSQLLQIDSLNFDSDKGTFAVGEVNLNPLYSKAEFAVKSPGHKDWTKVQAKGLVCRKIDMQQLMQNRILKIDSVSIAGAKISSYKNRQIEQAKQVKRLFYESVQEFPMPLVIGRIDLNNIDVEYQELSKNGLTPGTITFNGLKGVCQGLTNIVEKGKSYYTLRAQGKLMDKGVLQADFSLPVDSLNPHFEVKGSLGKMALQDLNPMLEPLAKVQITSGEIEELKFKITGNSMKSKVDMLFLYDGLKIRIMKEKDGKLETSSFFTTLANGLIPTANNPNHRGIRRADAEAERDIYRSQFNYLWRTLFAGLKMSIGL